MEQTTKQELQNAYNQIGRHFIAKTPNFAAAKLNKFGRPSNAEYMKFFLESQELPLNIFYLDSEKNQTRKNEEIFSFDKSQYEIFQEQILILKENFQQFNFINPYMITTLSLNRGTKQFNLKSKIFSNSNLDCHIHTTLEYLTAITQNPEQILQNKIMQHKFETSIGELQKNSIKLNQILELGPILQPQTQLTDFTVIDSQNSIYLIQSEKLLEEESPKIFSKKTELLTREKNPRKTLEIMLDTIELEPDKKKIEIMKSTERKQVLSTSSEGTKRRSLRAIKTSIDQTLTSKETQNIFSIHETTQIKEIIEKLSIEQLIKYFPFKIQGITNIEHVKNFLLS